MDSHNPYQPPTTTDQPAGWRGAARTSLALLLSINLLNYVDRYVLSAVVPKIQEEFFPGRKDADFWTGLLAFAFLITYMLTSPVFGWLADRGSRWLIVGIGVIVWSLASGAAGLATTFGAMMLARVFVGIGEASYGPVAPTIIADLYPVERRGRVMAWFYMAIPVGSALGYGLGGFVAKHWNWQTAFFVSAPPGIMLGLLAWLMRDPQRGASDVAQHGQAATAHRGSRLADYRLFWQTPSYVWGTAGMTAMTFALGGVAFWMPKFIEQQGVDPAHASITFGAITAVAGLSATLLGGLAGDWLRARYGGSYFLVSGIGMLLGFPFFLLVLFTEFPGAWAWIFLAEFCLFFNTGPTNTILCNVIHPSLRASAFALNILIIHLLGDAISPPLIGLLNDEFDGNMKVGFSAVSVAILISGVCWLCGTRHLAQDTARAPTRLAE
ncbi:MAG: MFS transporter [Planctomycetes bacterium]|nr:MFS transporter [Planctomycetota bacterium]